MKRSLALTPKFSTVLTGFVLYTVLYAVRILTDKDD